MLTKSDVDTIQAFELGNGLWCIEVRNLDEKLLKEFLGSNGCNPMNPVADNLWAKFHDWYDTLPE